MAREIPLYLVLGFLESGKTRFLKETLRDPAFTEDEKTLLIACEEGEEEYGPAFLEETRTTLVTVESPEGFTTEFLSRCQEEYDFDRVMLEYNGMWKVSGLSQVELPKGWVCCQAVTLVDCTTFPVYSANMRPLMMDKLSTAQMVIFNRCTPQADKNLLARTVRLVNRDAQLGFERPDGSEDTDFVEELPFDLDAPVIDLADEDYGVWYTDAQEDPKKYAGKTVRFRALSYISPKFPKGCFVPGRHAMVCCADDIAFMGFICKAGKYPLPAMEQWVTVTASVKVEFYPQYRGKGPVLYAQAIEPAEKPKEELVYF